ncbi:hypothetical protein VB712_03465 [Spirulina sp. CCNP1310]|nr:hypothetical protein [Spirulina sp. CCNP1310]MEA5418269.1 hypothetical protein [Spirulina sp. CCNP1310]
MITVPYCEANVQLEAQAIAFCSEWGGNLAFKVDLDQNIKFI